MLNSLSYIIVIIALGLIVNSMAGYAFARLKFPKKICFCTDPGSYDHSGSDSYASAVLYYL